MNLHWTQHLITPPNSNHPSLATCVFSLLLCHRWYWPLRGRCGSVHVHLGDILHIHLRRRKHINLQTLTKPVEMTAAAICILWLATLYSVDCVKTHHFALLDRKRGWDQQSVLEHLHHCQTALATSQNDNYQNHTLLLIFLRRFEWFARMKKQIYKYVLSSKTDCLFHSLVCSCIVVWCCMNVHNGFAWIPHFSVHILGLGWIHKLFSDAFDSRLGDRDYHMPRPLAICMGSKTVLVYHLSDTCGYIVTNMWQICKDRERCNAKYSHKCSDVVIIISHQLIAFTYILDMSLFSCTVHVHRINTLQKTKISHRGKKKIIFKSAFKRLRVDVSSQEGINIYIYIYPTIFKYIQN